MIAIEVGHLFDGQRVVPGGAVVTVEGTRIFGVAPRGTPVPDGCEVIRFPDATLLPGLIDAHVHLCCDSGPGALGRLPAFSDAELTAVIENALGAQLASGVTMVRDLGDRRWAVIDWRDRNRANTALPTVLRSGPPITSVSGHCWNMGGEAHGVEELRRAVRERAERGVDIVKIMASGGTQTPGTDAARAQFSAEEIRAVVDEAHACGLRVTAHAHALSAIRNALAAGVDGLEHCTFITDTGIDVADAVVADLVESGTPVCPTLGRAPGAVPPPGVLEMMRKTGMTSESRIRMVGGLHRAGVRLVSGSDGGINPGKRHGVLPEAVIQLVDGGVPAAAALTTATTGFTRRGQIDVSGRP